MASRRNQHCANCIGTLSFPSSVVEIQWQPLQLISLILAERRRHLK